MTSGLWSAIIEGTNRQPWSRNDMRELVRRQYGDDFVSDFDAQTNPPLLPPLTPTHSGSMPAVNRVYHCGALDLLKAMPSGSVDMTLTDIPYGEINHVARLHERAKYGNVLRNLHKSTADTVNFELAPILAEIERVTKGFIYIFCGSRQAGEIREFYTDRYLTRHCIWEKINPSPVHGQYIWLSSIENCICIRKPNTDFNEWCKSAVWRFPIASNQIHPTEKPLGLFEYLIESSSRLGDLVIDPFVGSGTTCVAARNLKRAFIGCDTDAGYVAIARDRLRAPWDKPMQRESAPMDELPLFAANATA